MDDKANIISNDTLVVTTVWVYCQIASKYFSLFSWKKNKNILQPIEA